LRLGLEGNRFNTTTFDEVTASRLRLEFDSKGEPSTGVLQRRVYDSGQSPTFARSVTAGVDRVAVMPGKTYLFGHVKDDGKVKASPKTRWSKKSGPGEVAFADAEKTATDASFCIPGEDVLELTEQDKKAKRWAEMLSEFPRDTEE
jgi:uncharacterized protein